MRLFNGQTGECVCVYFTCAYSTSGRRFSPSSTIWLSQDSPLWSFGSVLYIVILKDLPKELDQGYHRFDPYESPAWGMTDDYGGGVDYCTGQYKKGCIALSVHMGLVEGVLQVPPEVVKLIQRSQLPSCSWDYDPELPDWRSILSAWFFNN